MLRTTEACLSQHVGATAARENQPTVERETLKADLLRDNFTRKQTPGARGLCV
jgi:hypothetical protein